MKSIITNDKYKKMIIFLMFLISALIMAFGQANLSTQSPDEDMRYQLVHYLYEYGEMPHGGIDELQTPWGYSYAFMPYLSAIISAVLMKITSIFTKDAQVLLMAARMASVLFGCGAVYYVFKLSDKLFKTSFKWIFICIIAFLPQFVYISSYLNNDILGFMAICMITYYWIVGSEKNWNLQSIVGLSIGISICMLSYYNDYGIILMSVVYYFIDQYKKKTDKKEVMKKAFIISLLCFCLAGWFFIHNAYIYNGDFLGLKTLSEHAEKYAIPEVLSYVTIQEEGKSIFYMLFQMKWILITFWSFIAIFGAMAIKVFEGVYLYYGVLFLGGIILFGVSILKNIQKKQEKNYLLEICLFIGSIIAIVLSMYRSYTVHFQPQGRYIIVLLLPLSLGIARGIEDFKFINKNKNVLNGITILGICGMNLVILIYCCMLIFI